MELKSPLAMAHSMIGVLKRVRPWHVLSLLSVLFLLLGWAVQGDRWPSEPDAAMSRLAPIPTAMADAGNSSDGPKWPGPILWFNPEAGPIDLILVEKATQELRLVRYNGAYETVRTFKCASGESPGPKQKEKDKKTPEGIYFNNRTFRDTRVTVFGNRAFGLNYPDVFDRFEQNGGSGIFLHGSNREVSPYSTNGCVVMENEDLIQLEPYIRMGKTPIIIGERLPYQFGETAGQWQDLVPFLEKALVPDETAQDVSQAHLVGVFGFGDRVVAMGRLAFKDARGEAVSRLYLAGPSERLLVLVKREWEAVRDETVLLASADKVTDAPPKKEKPQEKTSPVVGSAPPNSVQSSPAQVMKKSEAPIAPAKTVDSKAADKPRIQTAAVETKTASVKPEARPPVEAPVSADTQQIKQLIESWRKSWQSKDLNAYITHYHGQFVGNGKGIQEWKAYKKSLNEKYQKISVQVSDLKVTVTGTRALVTFTQKYRSDQFQSIGLKNMELRKQGSDWKILNESAQPMKSRKGSG